MKKEYRWWHRLRASLPRLHHRRGYGIHSPFAFTWVTEVIYNSSAYYAYDALSELRPTTTGHLNEKDDRLLFRLANACQAHHIILIGNIGHREELYLKAGRTTAIVERKEKITEEEKLFLPNSLIYCASPEFLPTHIESGWPQLLSPAESGNILFVVHNIHRDSTATSLWENFYCHPAVSISFDLYRFGIAFLAPRFNKQHYTIHYY